jgi:hypothetical protein
MLRLPASNDGQHESQYKRGIEVKDQLDAAKPKKLPVNSPNTGKEGKLSAACLCAPPSKGEWVKQRGARDDARRVAIESFQVPAAARRQTSVIDQPDKNVAAVQISSHKMSNGDVM